MTDLHAQIMNLPARVPEYAARYPAGEGIYKNGHKDARHAAAELALSVQAELDALRADAARYRWLRDRLLAADFDYMGEGVQALVFEMPDGFQASADCDETIDQAMKDKP